MVGQKFNVGDFDVVLQAVYFDASTIIDVGILLLRGCKKLLVVKPPLLKLVNQVSWAQVSARSNKLDVSYCFSQLDLRSQFPLPPVESRDMAF